MTAWPRVSLGELVRLERRPVEVLTDRQYQEIGIFSYGRGFFHKTPRSGLEVGDKDLFIMKEGDLILQITFAWEGAIALCSKAEDGLYGSVRFPTYRVNEQRCFPPFLARYLCTHEGLDQVGRLCPGSAGRNRVLALKRLNEILIPLPALDEQRRIVNQIDELEVKIALVKRLRKKADIATASPIWGLCESVLMKCLLTSDAAPLHELVDQKRGISYGIVQTGDEHEGGVPTLRAGDLRWFSVRTSSVKRVDPDIERSFLRTRLKGNELLLRIRGGVGELAVCPNELIGGNVSREIAVIPFEELVDPKFAMYMLASPTNQTRMVGHTRGTSYVGINLKDIRNIPIPLPPFDMQKEIVAELDDFRARIGAIEELQKKTSAEIDALFPSIVDKAFHSELA